MKNKRKGRKKKEAVDNSTDSNNDESPSSCETRRKIEDLLERRRYQDELGDFKEVFDIPVPETV